MLKVSSEVLRKKRKEKVGQLWPHLLMGRSAVWSLAPPVSSCQSALGQDWTANCLWCFHRSVSECVIFRKWLNVLFVSCVPIRFNVSPWKRLQIRWRSRNGALDTVCMIKEKNDSMTTAQECKAGRFPAPPAWVWKFSLEICWTVKNCHIITLCVTVKVLNV